MRLSSTVLKPYWCQRGNKTQRHFLLLLGVEKTKWSPPPTAMREKDVGMSHKESPLAAQWLTKSLSGNRGGRLMNRDRNIPTQFCGQKQNVPGERGTYSSQHNGAFLSLARAPVWGNPSKPQQEVLVRDKKFAYKRRWTLQNSSKIAKNASSPFGATMIGWWPLFIHVHSACSLIPTLCVVRSAGMHCVESSRRADQRGSPVVGEASRTMAEQRGHLTRLATHSSRPIDNWRYN